MTSTKIVVQERAVAELRTRFEEVIFELSRLAQTEKLTAPTKIGGKYFFSKNNGLQNQNVLYVQETLDSKPPW